MADFSVKLDFIDLQDGRAPQGTDLLFFNAHARHEPQGPHYARGWVGVDGKTVLIGAQWVATHYARVPDFYTAALLAGAGRLGYREQEPGQR